MKKKIAVVLVAVLLLAAAFTGCSKSGNESIYPVLSVSQAKPGDTVSVEVFIDDAKYFCSTDLYLSYDVNSVTLVSFEAAQVPELISEVSSGEDGIGNSYIKFSGITTKTLDLDSCVLLKATFKVNEDAAAGEAFFGIAISEYVKGTDADGNNTQTLSGENIEGGAKLTITAG